MSLASVVRDGSEKVGVLKMGFSAAPLVTALVAAGAGVRIDVLDSADKIILGSDVALSGRVLRGMPGGLADSSGAVTITRDSVDERVLALRANANRWRVVAHISSDEIAAPFRTARLAIVGGAAALLLVLALLLAALNTFLQRRISNPAREIAEVAEAVAAGDFSVGVRHTSADDEIGRLSRAVGAMIMELRRLAQTIAGSAKETSGARPSTSTA